MLALRATCQSQSIDRSIIFPEGHILVIMCRRNAGLRSLLYALSVGAMSIEEIGRQQLEQPLLRLARHVIIYLMYYQDN